MCTKSLVAAVKFTQPSAVSAQVSVIFTPKRSGTLISQPTASVIPALSIAPLFSPRKGGSETSIPIPCAKPPREYFSTFRAFKVARATLSGTFALISARSVFSPSKTAHETALQAAQYPLFAV